MSFDLDGLVAACRAATDTTDPVAAVCTAVFEAITDGNDDLVARTPEPTGEEMMLHRSAQLTVVLAHLPPRRWWPVHEHRMTSVVGVYTGAEQRRFYRPKTGRPIVRGELNLAAGEIATLGPEVLLSVGAADGSPAASLRVYLGDLFGTERRMWDPTTGDAVGYELGQYLAWAAPTPP